MYCIALFVANKYRAALIPVLTNKGTMNYIPEFIELCSMASVLEIDTMNFLLLAIPSFAKMGRTSSALPRTSPATIYASGWETSHTLE